MTIKDKKAVILKTIELGDKRSYNEIAADLELYLWTLRHKGEEWIAKREAKKKQAA
jgi:hypothetical protein